MYEKASNTLRVHEPGSGEYKYTPKANKLHPEEKEFLNRLSVRLEFVTLFLPIRGTRACKQCHKTFAKASSNAFENKIAFRT